MKVKGNTMRAGNIITLLLIISTGCSGMLDDYDYNPVEQHYWDTVLHGYFVIDNDASRSYAPRTRLSIHVYNAVEMRFRNDNEVWPDDESGWMPFQGEIEWQLPSGCRSRTVYGQFRDSRGSVIASEDSIELIDMIRAGTGRSDDAFGHAIAVSGDGNTVVVGCPRYDNYTGSFPSVDEGAVFVYTWNSVSGTWDEYTIYGNGTAGDNFGCAVAVSNDGSRIVAGAYKNDENFVLDDNRGSAYIYEYSAGSGDWDLDTQLYETGSDRYGTSVAVSGDGSTVAVGALYDNRVYVYSGSGWGLQKTLYPAAGTAGIEYNHFGTSLAFSGTGSRLAVGSPGTVVASGRAGYVYIYSGSGSSWSEERLSIGAPYDYFGWDVDLSLDGSVLVVGAKGHEIDHWRQGSVHVFCHNGSGWGTPYDLVLPVAAGSDNFGYAVSVASDGMSLVAGSIFTDLNGTDRGGAFCYSWDGAGYVLTRELYAADGEPDDYFGCDVGISGDGITIAAGLLHDSVTADDQGSVYIYKNE